MNKTAAFEWLEKVTKIVIELGKVVEHGEEIQSENLEFNLGEMARDTIAANADIEIKKAGSDTWKLVEIEGG